MADMRPSFGEFCWNELATADITKAKDFYGKVFGWQFKDVDMGDYIYTMVKGKDREIAGMWHIPTDKQGQIPPHWMSYILVEDIAAALTKAKQFGAKVMKDVTQAGDLGKLAIITDPTGAHVALWEVLQMK